MKPVGALFAATLSCALAIPAEASTWAPQTSPPAVALNGVASSDSNTWVAVGDAGTIVRSTDRGFGWSAVSVRSCAARPTS